MRIRNRRLLLFCSITPPLFVLASAWLAGSVMSRPVNHSVGALPSNLSGSEVEFHSASGATIRGWLVPGRKGRGAVVLMHGYRGDRTQVINRAPFLNQAGCTVLAFDFQAHGESKGESITIGYL